VKDQIRNDITSVNKAMTSGEADKIKEASERLKTFSKENVLPSEERAKNPTGTTAEDHRGGEEL